MIALTLGACRDKNATGIDPNGSFTVPDGYVAVNFSIDDQANRTYEASDGLAWKGSFSYESTTRVLTKDAAWGGPFPLLFDDGSWDTGGHEPEGAVAGDDIWGVAVLVEVPATPVAFEYGAIRGSVSGSDGEWIWTGTNGSFTVDAGQVDPVIADGLTIPEFGDIDVRLTLDANDVDASFGAFDPADGVAAKSSHWSWSEIDFSDDGTDGDETAGDDLFTLVLSAHMGAGTNYPHVGLARSAEAFEFLMVLAGIEYRVGGDPATQGVTAELRAPGDPDWSPITIQSSSSGNALIDVP